MKTCVKIIHTSLILCMTIQGVMSSPLVHIDTDVSLTLLRFIFAAFLVLLGGFFAGNNNLFLKTGTFFFVNHYRFNVGINGIG